MWWLFITVLALTEAANDYPIVGIFSQPSHSHAGTCGGDCLYIAASYVKFIESAGARVVPINYYADETELSTLFKSLNGFLFPGGGNDFPPTAQYIWDKTIEANDKGDFMPLQGTCLGFEWLLIAATRNQSILDPQYPNQMDAHNLSIPLEFTAAAPTSRLYAQTTWGGSLYTILETENVTLNNHHYGIYPSHFMNTPALSSFFSVLSTNKDRKGTEFVSSIEAFNYPIYGVQWHPEKNIFEWGMTDEGIPKEAINHSPHGVEVAEYMADFFVQQCRNSTHKFANAAQETNALIYNYPAVYTSGSFVSTYYFANDFSSLQPAPPTPSSCTDSSSSDAEKDIYKAATITLSVILATVLAVCAAMYVVYVTGCPCPPGGAFATKDPSSLLPSPSTRSSSPTSTLSFPFSNPSSPSHPSTSPLHTNVVVELV